MEIKIGIPNRGRLAEACVKLVNMTWDANIDLRTRKMNYHLETENLKLNLCLMRSTDITKMIEKREIDIGITGSDYFLESEADIIESNNLFLLNGILCVISSKKNCGDKSKYKSCCSQYSVIADNFFRSSDVEVKTIDGAAETYLQLNACDCAIDIVTTGETAVMNDVKVDFVIMPVSAHIYINNFFFEKNENICKTIVENLSGQPMVGYHYSESITFKRFCAATNEYCQI